MRNIDAAPLTATASNSVALPQSVSSAPKIMNPAITSRPPIRLRGAMRHSSTISRAAEASAESSVESAETSKDSISATKIQPGNISPHVPISSPS